MPSVLRYNFSLKQRPDEEGIKTIFKDQSALGKEGGLPKEYWKSYNPEKNLTDDVMNKDLLKEYPDE